MPNTSGGGGNREQYDAWLLLKRDGLYQNAGVVFDVERGKFWLQLENEVLCIEAPRLRHLVRKYDERLGDSGLGPRTDDGYAR